MKKFFALLALPFVLPFYPAAHAADAPANCSLLVAEFQPGKNVADPQLLVRYRLENGALKKREVLATAAASVAHYEFGDNRVYMNRYVVTPGAEIFDLESGKYLRNYDGGKLIACEDGKVIVFNTNDGEFYSYDLAGRQFAKMDNPGKWALLLKTLPLSRPATISPDGTKSVVDATADTAGKEDKGGASVFGSKGPLEFGAGKLTLCTLGGKAKLLGTGFLSKVSPKSDTLAQTPVMWLDNDRILTQRGNGKIVILKLDGSVEPVADLNIQAVPLSPPDFSRDPAGRIIYTCTDSYVIDVEKKNFAKLEWRMPGDSFEIEVVKAPSTSRIRYMGKEIGFDSVDPAGAKTIAGHIAIAPAKSNATSQRMIRVWSSISKSWTNLELGGSLISIIGWVEDGDPGHPAGN